MKSGRLRVFFAFAIACALAASPPAQAVAAFASVPTWAHARIVERGGHAIFEVDGKPFFMYGAAFFYERLPRDAWDGSMMRLREMGINTLDLYVPWNWHELADGDFDFTGRTSPRRDFDEVLRLAKLHDFKIVLRPGPVVRNEWRNGGYPAWLLQRPEYGMPAHDILEGRYPATATLQNQHSDDAAAQWMGNVTHVTYAKRWLERVLRETQPYADRVLAVALDDDQAAYIDNQTYPAPHLRAYLEWLRDVVHGVTGPDELTFINTYQMKVPATSPVWAMGNWYQSDAFAIGTHDESQLAFSMAQLATRPHQPLFASEFQAGWLQGAGEAYPRGADPSNTELALATMVGTGVRGMINFPAQDTLDPTGWEAPFANFAYAWDAALGLDGDIAARYRPTAAFGGLVRAYGPDLATSFPRFDAGIVYAGTSVATDAPNGTFSAIASATIDAQRACRDAGYACDLIDVEARDPSTIARGATLLLPAFDAATRGAITARLARRLAELVATRAVRVAYAATAADVRTALRARAPAVAGADDAVFSESLAPARVAGFLSVTNYSDHDRTFGSAVVTLRSGERIALPPFVVRAHAAITSPVDARLALVFPGEPGAARSVLETGDVLRFSTCMPLRWLRGTAGLDAFWSAAGGGSAATGDRPSCAATFASGNKRRTLRVDSDLEEATFDLRAGAVLRQPRVTRTLEQRPRAYDVGTPLELRPGFVLADDRPIVEPSAQPSSDRVTFDDVFREGADSVTLADGNTRLIVSPNAGARAFFFASGGAVAGANWFTTVGGLRDDVAIEPPLSTTDRIAKYTHDFPAGTFNRRYDARRTSDDAVALSYAAPDVVPSGAIFDRTVRLAKRGGSAGFDLDERVDFADLRALPAQRGVSVSSFALGPAHVADARVFAPLRTSLRAGTTIVVTSGNALAIARTPSDVAIVAWHAGDVERAELRERADSVVVRLTFALGRTSHVIFRIGTQPDTTVEARIAAVEAEAQVTPSPARTR